MQINCNNHDLLHVMLAVFFVKVTLHYYRELSQIVLMTSQNQFLLSLFFSSVQLQACEFSKLSSLVRLFLLFSPTASLRLLRIKILFDFSCFLFKPSASSYWDFVVHYSRILVFDQLGSKVVPSCASVLPVTRVLHLMLPFTETHLHSFLQTAAERFVI